MKSLNLEQSYTVLKLAEADTSGTLPLCEQAKSFIDSSPFLIIDLREVRLTSMLIGELINLYQAYQERWKDSSRKLALSNVSDFNRRVLEQVRLSSVIDLHDSLDSALDGV